MWGGGACTAQGWCGGSCHMTGGRPTPLHSGPYWSRVLLQKNLYLKAGEDADVVTTLAVALAGFLHELVIKCQETAKISSYLPGDR